MASSDRDADHETADESLQNERFVRLFAQTRDALFAHVFALLPNWTDAEDVFQQISLVLWRKFGEFSVEVKGGTDSVGPQRPQRGSGNSGLSASHLPADAFLAWARRVAYFEVCNFRRMAGRDRLQFNDQLLEHLADERGNHAEPLGKKREFLIDCVAKLTDDQRELLLRAYDDVVTIQQLAANIHRAPQTIYNRLGQIRRTLFRCVEESMRREEAKP
jgi:RNA polymerase sigma-70 factor, ECF subfamily